MGYCIKVRSGVASGVDITLHECPATMFYHVLSELVGNSNVTVKSEVWRDVVTSNLNLRQTQCRRI